MKIKNEKELLDLFVGRDKQRPWMSQPFINLNDPQKRVWATDAYTLIMINARVLKDKYASEDRPLYIDLSPNCNSVISRDDLIRALKKCPKAKRECAECNGSGQVIADYRDVDGKYHRIEGKCPICNGTGLAGCVERICGDMRDLDVPVRVDRTCIGAYNLHKLLAAMELLGVDSVVYTVANEKGPNLFIVNEDVCIAIASLIIQEEGLGSITLKTTKP